MKTKSDRLVKIEQAYDRIWVNFDGYRDRPGYILFKANDIAWLFMHIHRLEKYCDHLFAELQSGQPAGRGTDG